MKLSQMLLSLVGYMVCALLVLSARPIAAADDASDFKIFAKRGYYYDYPENSLEGMTAACAVTGSIELDLQITKDGVLILMHDATIDRTTDGTGAVTDFTFEKISALDAGHTFGHLRVYSFSDLHTFHPWDMLTRRWIGTRIPTLDSVARMARDGGCEMWIDAKADGMADALAVVLAQAKSPLERAFITSGSAERTEPYVALFPEAQIVHTGPIPDGYDDAYFQDWKARGRNGFMASFKRDNLTKEFIDAAHRNDMFVIVRFARSEGMVEETLAFGADGALTMAFAEFSVRLGRTEPPLIQLSVTQRGLLRVAGTALCVLLPAAALSSVGYAGVRRMRGRR
jgi:glycerophosphoryl diester phosphodiesterase